jgi:hypothetical protein
VHYLGNIISPDLSDDDNEDFHFILDRGDDEYYYPQEDNELITHRTTIHAHEGRLTPGLLHEDPHYDGNEHHLLHEYRAISSDDGIHGSSILDALSQTISQPPLGTYEKEESVYRRVTEHVISSSASRVKEQQHNSSTVVATTGATTTSVAETATKQRRTTRRTHRNARNHRRATSSGSRRTQQRRRRDQVCIHTWRDFRNAMESDNLQDTFVNLCAGTISASDNFPLEVTTSKTLNCAGGATGQNQRSCILNFGTTTTGGIIVRQGSLYVRNIHFMRSGNQLTDVSAAPMLVLSLCCLDVLLSSFFVSYYIVFPHYTLSRFVCVGRTLL